MQHVTIDWFRLLRYSLLFLVFSTLVAMFTVFWFSENLQDAWHKGLMLSVTELEMTLELSLTLFIYVSFPYSCLDSCIIFLRCFIVDAKTV